METNDDNGWDRPSEQETCELDPWMFDGGPEVISAEQAAEDLPALIESVCHGEPVIISTGEIRAVLIGESDFRSLIETLNLLQEPEMASDLDRTRRSPVSEMEVWRCVNNAYDHPNDIDQPHDGL